MRGRRSPQPAALLAALTLAALLCAERAGAVAEQAFFEQLTRSAALRAAGTALGGLAAFRAGAALSVIGQPRVPPLPDEASARVGLRTVRVGPTGCRARLFYPCASGAPGEPAPYLTDGRLTSDGMAGLVAFDKLGLSFLLAHLARASSGCEAEAPAPPREAARSLPLLVYSHGYGGNMDMATFLMRAIAAEGAVVLALEHTDGTASRTVLQSGAPLPFSPGLMSPRAQLARRAEELAAGAAHQDALPADVAACVDPERVFLGGHSYGGPSALAAAELLAQDRAGPRPRGLLLHDPALAMSVGPLHAPRAAAVVSYVSDEYCGYGVRCGRTLHCVGAKHGNFVDAALWAPLWVMRPLSLAIPAAGPVDPTRFHLALARHARSVMAAAREDGASGGSELEVAAGAVSAGQGGDDVAASDPRRPVFARVE